MNTSDASSIVTIMESAIALAGIWVVLFWLWPALRLDCFRQQMFAVRDELFDYAAAGKISFNHPAYRLLRQQMNGFIRYGHKLSFGQFLLTLCIWKLNRQPDSYVWSHKWDTALKSLDDETVGALRMFHNRALMHVASRIVFGSPILLPCLLASLLAVLFHAGLRSMGEAVTAATRATANRTLDQRILEEEAARAAA